MLNDFRKRFVHLYQHGIPPTIYVIETGDGIDEIDLS